MESMWAEKQTLLRAMANLKVDWPYATSVRGVELQCTRPLATSLGGLKPQIR